MNPERGTKLTRGAATVDFTLRYGLTTADTGMILVSATDGLPGQYQPLIDRTTSVNVDRGSGQVNVSMTIKTTESTGWVEVIVALFAANNLIDNSTDAYDRVTFSLLPPAQASVP